MTYVEDGFSFLKTTISVARVPWSFLLRDLLLACIITVASLSCFGIDYIDTGSRLGLLSTILLTLAAFQFVVSQNLPSLPILTIADRYMISCFVFTFSLMAIIASTYYIDMDSTTDQKLLISFVAVFAAYHIIFAIVGRNAYLRTLRCNSEYVSNPKLWASKVFPVVSNKVTSRGVSGSFSKYRDSASSIP